MNIIDLNTQNKINQPKNNDGILKFHEDSNNSSNNTSKGKKGFALISTIMIISLLMIIALATMNLSNVEQRTTKNSQDIVLAKANARMALMMALGDLQRQMGPDSRISAPYNTGIVATGGQPHWTAVYDAWEMAEAGVAEDPATRIPKFRGWLVSGSNTDPLTGVTITDPNNQILMLGSGTLGTQANSSGQPNSAPYEVRVPSIAINEDTTNGRMAWWISDEGVKAKVNAGPSDKTLASFGKADLLFHSQAPLSIGHKTVTGLEDHTWTPRLLGSTVSTKELNLAAGLGKTGIGTAIHDITVHSEGVLADVRTGRLKRDLSALLSRPIEAIENKPLYVADGRMNRFNIGLGGTFENGPGIPGSWTDEYNSGGHWGINLEELHLYHSLPKSLDWSGGTPSLVMPSTREAAVADRHYIYKRPGIEAMQFIFSLRAIEDTEPGSDKKTYKMEMRMDAMVALWNPNDVPLVYSPGLQLPVQLLWLPYKLQWDITKVDNTKITTSSQTKEFKIFRGNVGNSAGFTLEPGEAAAFGSGQASGYQLNLTRGFVPNGEVQVVDWDLEAEKLDADATINYKFVRREDKDEDRVQGNWLFANVWLGPRSPGHAWQMDQFAFRDIPGKENDAFFPPEIKPTQGLKVSDFIDKAKPVIMLSIMQNVEKPSGTGAIDAFASRPYQLGESSIHRKFVRNSKIETDRHTNQFIGTAEGLDFTFKSLAGGDGGRNIYIGGGRQPGFGGTFNRISRRTPLSPPLSLAAFQHGIATGIVDHWKDEDKRSSINVKGATLRTGSVELPAAATALAGNINAFPPVKSVIGNSSKLPNIPKNVIFHTGSDLGLGNNVVVAKVASDHSWLSNTALWDNWFLSGVVDGTGPASTPYQTDNRTARQQFSDFANGIKPLRNTRFKFHAHKSPTQTVSELFTIDDHSLPAINLMANYLLVDGAFNVNSTSETAWLALLSSVRNQEIMDSSGNPQGFTHPFGTLGYAAGTETEDTAGDWTGLRDLSVAEIESLATAIVVEVKDRGPFLSMSDFVNRRPNSSNPEHQVIGALQAAIDKAGLNSEVTGGDRDVKSSDFAGLDGSSGIDDEPAPARSVGAPGHLSQGDILTAIGSQITVRSDTFVIRAYGDVRSANDPNIIVASAWCEAVIQRYPEYVDSTDAPEAQDGWPSATDTLSEANKIFGRRFQVKSFRWLNSKEI